MKLLIYLSLCHRMALCLTLARGTEEPREAESRMLKLIFGEPNEIESLLQERDCTTATGEAGRCVAVKMCRKGDLDNFGRYKINIRAGFEDDTPPAVCSYLEKCCAAADVIGISSTTEEPDHKKPGKSGCGWANPHGVGFSCSNAVHGESQFAEFPWVVAIVRETSKGLTRRYEGSGSLINPTAVLTAAHKVAPVWRKRKLFAKVGEWDSETTDEMYPHQEITVVDARIHNQYNHEVLLFDVAILFLERPVSPAPNIGYACLPAPSLTPARDVQCSSTGWGKNKFGKAGHYQHILKKVQMKYVQNDECQLLLRINTILGAEFLLHQTFMCAGGGDEDTCSGDGGAPLICPIQDQEDRFVQHGVVAWGIGCGRRGVPGVYVDVAYLRPWIDQVVTGSGLDPSYYTYETGGPTVIGGPDIEFIA